MSIDPNDLKAIEQQVQVSKGPLSFGVQHDTGDSTPPPIDQALSNNQDVAPQPVNVEAALKGIMTMTDMVLKLGFSRVEQVDYAGFTDSELTILAQSGTQVPELSSIATSESTGKYMFYITLLGMMGSKFKWSEEHKAKKAREKALKDSYQSKGIEQSEIEALKEIANSPMSDDEIAAKLVGKPKKEEPVYDAPPVDTSEPVQVLTQYEETLDPDELKIYRLLHNESELSKPELDQRRNEATLRSKMIARAERIAKENASKKGIDYAD